MPGLRKAQQGYLLQYWAPLNDFDLPWSVASLSRAYLSRECPSVYGISFRAFKSLSYASAGQARAGRAKSTSAFFISHGCCLQLNKSSSAETFKKPGRMATWCQRVSSARLLSLLWGRV